MRNLMLTVAMISGLTASFSYAEERGSVLVTKDRRLTEGDIEKRGDRYIIRRGSGETVLAAEHVLCLVASRHDAYKALLGAIDPQDAKARVELSRWCFAHGLREEALVEAKVVARLRPEDLGIKQMVSLLESALNKPRPMPVPVAEVEQEVREIAEPASFNTASVPMFATQVQPVLMNTCLRCHGADGAGGFQLERVTIGERDRRATQRNLVAMLVHVDRKNLAGSAVLTKAVVAHGDDPTPPIHDRTQPAYQVLEMWLRLMAAPEGTSLQFANSPPEPTFERSPVNAIPSALPVGMPSGIGEPPPLPVDAFDPAAEEDPSR